MKQSEALELLKMGKNVYLTGPAGSGKTYVINSYINYLRERGVGVGVTASTGIAATHIGGMTVHSWFGIGIRESLSPYEIDALSQKPHLHKRFEKTKVIVIDEISMLHAHRLDMIDLVCREMKRSGDPFGGMQVIFSGDFFQLPPVSRGSVEENHFAYHSHVWGNMDLHICYLSEQYRQTDDELSRILEDIRTDNVGEHTLVPLRTRYRKKVIGVEKPTRLHTHNANVDAENARELAKLPGEIREYEMKTSGSKALVESLKKSVLAPETFGVKEGASVMFVKNNFEKGYVNGTLGVVEGFEDGYPVVKTAHGERIIATPESFRIEEDGKVKAEVEQVPLRLAWAITVHKSQGMSLDAAQIDLSQSFVPGMGYVALSRVRTLSGMQLMGLNTIALDVDKNILEFDTELRTISMDTSEGLSRLQKNEKEKKTKDFLSRIGAKEPGDVQKESKQKDLPTHEKTKALIKEKMRLEDIAKERKLTVGTILTHMEKIAQEGDRDLVQYLRPNKKKQKEIEEAFTKAGDTRLSSVKSILGSKYSFEELRLSRLFIENT